MKRIFGFCLALTLVACGGSSTSDGGTTGTNTIGGNTTGGGTSGGTSGGGTTGGTSGGGDIVAACTTACATFLSCSGQSTAACGATCATNASYLLTGLSCTNPVGMLNCLGGLSCAQLNPDAGGSGTVSCALANGCG